MYILNTHKMTFPMIYCQNENFIKFTYTKQMCFSTSNAMANPMQTNGQQNSKNFPFPIQHYDPTHHSKQQLNRFTLSLAQHCHKFPTGYTGSPISTPKIAPFHGVMTHTTSRSYWFVFVCLLPLANSVHNTASCQ